MAGAQGMRGFWDGAKTMLRVSKEDYQLLQVHPLGNHTSNGLKLQYWKTVNKLMCQRKKIHNCT